MFSQNVVDAREVISNSKPDFWDSQPFSQQWVNSQTSSQQGSNDIFSQQSSQMHISADRFSSTAHGIGSDYWSQSNSSQTLQERKNESFHSKYMAKSPLFSRKNSMDCDTNKGERNFQEFLHANRTRKPDQADSSSFILLSKELKFILKDFMDELKTMCTSIKESIEHEVNTTKTDLLCYLEKNDDIVGKVKEEFTELMTEMKNDIKTVIEEEPKLRKVVDVVEQQEERLLLLGDRLEKAASDREKVAEDHGTKLDLLIEQGKVVLEQSSKKESRTVHLENCVQTELTSDEISKALEKMNKTSSTNSNVEFNPIPVNNAYPRRFQYQSGVEYQQRNESFPVSLSNCSDCCSDRNPKQLRNMTHNFPSNTCSNSHPTTYSSEGNLSYWTNEDNTNQALQLCGRSIKASPMAIVMPRQRREGRKSTDILDNSTTFELTNSMHGKTKEDPSNIFMFELDNSDSEESNPMYKKALQYQNEQKRFSKGGNFKKSLVDLNEQTKTPKRKVQHSIKRYGKIVKSSSGRTKHFKTEVRKDFKAIRRPGTSEGSLRPLVGMIDQKISTRQSIVTRRKVFADQAFAFLDDDKEMQELAYRLRTRCKK